MTEAAFAYCLWTGIAPAWWWADMAMHWGLKAC
jgi:hypothetical protein